MGGVAGMGTLWMDSRLEVCKSLITLTSLFVLWFPEGLGQHQLYIKRWHRFSVALLPDLRLPVCSLQYCIF